MKNWGWKNWTMAVLMGLIFVVAGAGVTYGVLAHKEPGFAHEENRWDHVPLVVACSGYTPADQGSCNTTEHVVGVINHRLGFEMLQYHDSMVNPDIAVTMNAPVDVESAGPCDQPGECFELTGSGATYDHCDMQTMNVAGGGDLQLLVVYHGFGHCLGLAHDDHEVSIMRPTQRVTPDRTIPPWFSDYDRGQLRDRYNP